MISQRGGGGDDEDDEKYVPDENVVFNEKEKAISQSRMIAFLLLRYISRKDKNSTIFVIYKGLDYLIKYIYILYKCEKITYEERESIILFFSNIISSKNIQDKLGEKRLKSIVSNFRASCSPRYPDPILKACLQFFLNFSRFEEQHDQIAKKVFLTNLYNIYNRPEPDPQINLLIQMLLSNLSFTPSTHKHIIRNKCYLIFEKADESNVQIRHFINISKLNLALNYETYIYLQNSYSELTQLPLMRHINPVAQIRLYKTALQYLIKVSPHFVDMSSIPEGMFYRFTDPRENKGSIFDSITQGNLSGDAAKKPVLHVLETCFANLIESIKFESVYISKRAVFITQLLLNHPYLSEAKINAPSLLMNIISIAYSFPDIDTRMRAHEIITKIQACDFFFDNDLDYSDTMNNWFSKCTKVLMNIHKIEEESCRGYIFEYFFKFLSCRFCSTKRINSSIKNWVINSKFDLLVYLLFVKHKFVSQDLFDYLSECLANCFLVPEILNKFDLFLVLNYFHQHYGDMKGCRPASVAYLVGILYTVLEKYKFDLSVIADRQIHYQRSSAVETMHDFNIDNVHNKLFVTAAPKQTKTKNESQDQQKPSEKTVYNHSEALASPPSKSNCLLIKTEILLKISTLKGEILLLLLQ